MKILLTAPYHEEGQKELENALGDVINRPWKDHGRAFNPSELISLLRETQADALITEHDEVTKEVIEAFPDLQFIGVCRGTPSNVCLETAALYNIPVFHTPARNAQAVAELFLATVIDMLRFVFEGSAWLKGGGWGAGAHTSYLQFKGNEMAGKTIGMVGFGAVGQRIAEMVENFPCKISFYDPYLKEFDPKYTKATIEEVFRTSDIVSIHLPVTPDTIGMINKDLISLMKKDAIFVNTARASVVVREDLCFALENNLIRGAILDVFDHEPPDATDNRIINLPNVLATPHIAGATDEVEDHHVEILNRKIMNWFATEKAKLTNF
ncbi:NAD(P)-dependent oxidoreductase [Pedobacter duraquae]|uniref:D-3-phosphoglycerate dehydrogenase n=1 Tax=Pedobacter duraquae TaxID=425511 RepID=A0A4R6ILG8_9SPHI|nr:NAD(P)-dependent oxidoreductase [Pedobacter duraquae]TDO22901.1 D-3-phosphoglycerate dehydrogenase [Pedobacter duraquae]